MRKNSQDAVGSFAVLRQRAGVRARTVLGGLHGETHLTVGYPDQVIERTLKLREYFGDYQRQLFLVDHAGLPQKTVLEQVDMLGEYVIPVLRKEFAVNGRKQCRTRHPRELVCEAGHRVGRVARLSRPVRVVIMTTLARLGTHRTVITVLAAITGLYLALVVFNNIRTRHEQGVRRARARDGHDLQVAEHHAAGHHQRGWAVVAYILIIAWRP